MTSILGVILGQRDADDPHHSVAFVEEGGVDEGAVLSIHLLELESLPYIFRPQQTGALPASGTAHIRQRRAVGGVELVLRSLLSIEDDRRVLRSSLSFESSAVFRFEPIRIACTIRLIRFCSLYFVVRNRCEASLNSDYRADVELKHDHGQEDESNTEKRPDSVFEFHFS